MIELVHVSKTFNPGLANEVKALIDIQIEIPESQFLVLVGANGSGKSTLLNCIAGAFRPDTGKVIVEGQAVNRLADFRRSRWIARIFQNPLKGTAPNLSILDNFRLAALRTRPKYMTIGIRDAFRREVQEKISLLNMGLEDKLNQKMGNLSGGQRQALTLVMAVMDEARILLMDEPSAALDPKSARNLMEKAQMIKAEFGLTSVLVTHDLRDAHQYGNRLIQMQEGRIIRDLDEKEKNALRIQDLFSWFT